MLHSPCGADLFGGGGPGLGGGVIERVALGAREAPTDSGEAHGEGKKKNTGGEDGEEPWRGRFEGVLITLWQGFLHAHYTIQY